MKSVESKKRIKDAFQVDKDQMIEKRKHLIYQLKHSGIVQL